MKKFLKLFKTWKEELIGIPLALIAFFLMGPAIRWIDPEAGIYDAGVLQVINLSLVKVMSFTFFAWLAICFIFPEIWDSIQNKFDDYYNSLTPWEKVKTSLFIFFAFLFALVFAAHL